MKNRKRLVSVMAGVMAAIMLLSLILSLIPTQVGAASSSEIKKQIAALKEEKTMIWGDFTTSCAYKMTDTKTGLLHEQSRSLICF